MFPLLAGLYLDFYLIASLILPDTVMSITITVLLGGAFFVLWFVLPRNRALQGLMRH